MGTHWRTEPIYKNYFLSCVINVLNQNRLFIYITVVNTVVYYDIGTLLSVILIEHFPVSYFVIKNQFPIILNNSNYSQCLYKEGLIDYI